MGCDFSTVETAYTLHETKDEPYTRYSLLEGTG